MTATIGAAKNVNRLFMKTHIWLFVSRSLAEFPSKPVKFLGGET